MRHPLIRLALLALPLLFAATALAGGVLDDYQSRYSKKAQTSERSDVVKELVATGKPEALKALQHCAGVAKALLEDANKDVDARRAELAPVEAKIAEKEQALFDQYKKQGKDPPSTRPRYPEDDTALEIQSRLDRALRKVASEQIMIREALDALGAVVTKLPPDAQKLVRDDWTKNRIGSKDWGVRVECYEILGHTPAPWAFDMLVEIVANEADPRALIVAIDGLAGRDPGKSVPVLLTRIDDVRWLVRAAVITALEFTPSKESIDAIVKRMQKEDGRLKDDCRRALTALTGTKDIPANPEMWRVWWEANREKWTGKPPVEDPDKPPPVTGLAPVPPPPPKEGEARTGFFGLTVESKRVVFVIDISGSMNAPIGGKGPEAKTTRAAYAKAELKRVLAALEDGALFNIVFFSAGVRVWKPDMQKSDQKIRKEAMEFVDAAEVVGGTNTYDALEAAFGIGDMGKGKKREADPTGDARVDSIVLLSDGKPTFGKVTEPDQIRAAVKGWNLARRIAVHAIAFGNDADEKFMKGLAFDTGGTFVSK